MVASTPVTWLFSGAGDSLISLGLGLLGVLLARTVFIAKENRALGRKQPWVEQAAITAVACLIAGGIIWDGHLLYSKAIFTGVGIGWSTIAAINFISRIIVPGGPANRDPGADHADPDPAPHLSDTSIRRSLGQAYRPPLVGHPDLDSKLRELGEDQE